MVQIQSAREANLDGLVGPTHNYAGLSEGNLASERHAKGVSRPRAAALQGLRKARLLVAEGSRQWNATMDAPSLTLTGVKLPEDAEECESDVDRNADRSANWLALHEIVQGLYGMFLKERLAPGFKTGGAEQMARWMAGGK
jgi:hypothetical protein